MSDELFIETVEMVTRRIAKLPDPDAVRVLAWVLDADGCVFDPFRWRQQEPELREAVTDPALAALAEPTASSPPGDGDLARAALVYLADTQPRLTATVSRAIALRPDQAAERFDPLTLAIGGLIVLALQTDVTLARDTHGRWRFRLHKQPMKDSTLGTLLGKLITAFGGGQR